MFNVDRLELARKRRRMTARELAAAAGISSVTLSRIVGKLQTASDETVVGLIRALDFPREFFYRGDIDPIDVDAASFRSLTAMTARERDAALAAGGLAFEMADWVRSRFNLPSADIPDLGHETDPANAARALRQHWSIGERPIAHMVKLLEAKGVRVFSLSENTKTVDAFSCWRGDEPYVFLNTFKTAERSRFDAAHELGHLILHRHGGPQGRQAEIDAQIFASHFLMPRGDLIAQVPFVTTLRQLISAKKRWGVSVSALSYALHKEGRISDWTYRGFCIQINREFGVAEPEGLEPEGSSVWQSVLSELWKEGVSRNHLASALALPFAEAESLLFGLTGNAVPPTKTDRPSLRAI